MTAQNDKPSKGTLSILWILATETGWIAGMGTIVLLGEVINPLTHGIMRAIAWGTMGMLVGIIIGGGQWFVMKKVGLVGARPSAIRWFVSAILGWGLGIGIVIGLGTGDLFGLAISGLILGFTVGGIQTIVVQTNRSAFSAMSFSASRTDASGAIDTTWLPL